jgi:hypothetical protein
MSERNENHNVENLITMKPDKHLTIYIENYYKYYSLLFLTALLIGIGYGCIYTLVKGSDIISQIGLIFGLIINLMIIIIIIRYNANKIELVKDEANNLLRVIKYNLLCCKKNIIDFTLENAMLDLIVDKGRENSFYHLLIINIFKNKSEIDLNKSNIKNKPVTIYYLIKNIQYQKKLSKESLNNFLGIVSEIENPIVEHFTGIQLASTLDYKIKQYMKISNNFCSYYFKGPFMDDILLYIFLVLIDLCCMLGSFIYSYLIHKISGIILSIIVIILLIILNYYVLYKRFNLIRRIDIVYSNDFKTMFIGLVKYNEKSYKKTFIFEIELIERFILQEYKKSKKIFTIKIMLKDNGLQDICNIEDTKSNLLNLLDKLNEKFENKKE